MKSRKGSVFSYGADSPKAEIRILWWKTLILRTGLVALIVLLVAGLSLAFIKREGIRNAYRQRMVAHNIEKARTALNAGDWDAAQNHARSALAVRPDDAEAVRIRFAALRELDHPQLLGAAYALFANPSEFQSQLPDALEVALEKGPQAYFIRLFANMPPEIRRSVRIRTILARFHNRRSDFASALGAVHFSDAFGDFSPALRVEQCRALVGLGAPDALAEARSIFTNLIETSRRSDTATDRGAKAAAREDGDAALKILEIFSRNPRAFGGLHDLPDLADWVATQPQATVKHHLLAMHQQMVAKPNTRGDQIAAAIDKHAAEDPVAVGEWLYMLGAHEPAVQVLRESAASIPDAWILLVRHFMKLPDLQRARSLMNHAPSATDSITVACLDALVYHAEGDQRGLRRAFRVAMDAASHETQINRYFEIAHHANIVDAELPFIDAWVAAIRFRHGPIPQFAELEPVIVGLAKHGRAQDIHDITRILVSIQPEDPVLRMLTLYFSLLFDSSGLDATERELDLLLEAHPDFLEVHAARAFAALIGGRPDDALEALEAVGETPRFSQDTRLAIAATAHAIADRPDAARTLLEQVTWTNMLPKEREVFFRILSAKAAAGLPLPELSIIPEAPPNYIMIDSVDSPPDAPPALPEDRPQDQNEPASNGSEDR